MRRIFLLGLTLIFILFAGINVAIASPVQWKSSDGGNEHWYDVVLNSSSISWSDAKLAAESAIYSGENGYLASITSESENSFVASLFGTNDWKHNGTNGFMGPWIGGFQPDPSNSSAWAWTTGETWNYAKWEVGQPTNSGGNQDFVHYFILGSSVVNQPATWNDYADISNKVFGYVVEYNSPVVTPEPVSSILFSLGLGIFGWMRLKYKKI